MRNAIEITEKTPVGQKIIELYNNKGMSAGEIHEYNFDEVPFCVSKINGCLKIFKEKGLLKTEEEIRRIKKRRKLENNPNVQKIIKLVGQGIIAKEIYEDKENGIYLCQDRISKIIGECREYGLINPKEEKKAKELRDLKENPIKQTIIKLYNDGIRPYERDMKNLVPLSSQAIELCVKKAKEYGLIKSDKEIQIARKKRKNENSTVKRIIELVNDENMTSYSISKYKSDEIPLSRQRIDQIINECEEQGLIVRKKKKTKKIEKEKKQEEIPNINEFLNEVKKIYEGQDSIEVIWKYISIGKYKEALDIIRSRYQSKSGIESKKEKENLIKLEKLLIKACKVQTAIKMIKEEHRNIEDINKSTGLSKEKIAIIKMKLENKRVKMLTISKREEAISELLKGKNSIYIQNMLNISDLEMIDIENQSKYRQVLPEKRDFEAQIKQDSVTRVIVLVTKLGKKPEIIAKALNLKLEVVEECLKNALKVKLIKDNELQGIDLLDYGISNDKERVQ